MKFFSLRSLFLHRRKLHSTVCNVWVLAGGDIWLYCHIFWMREELWVGYFIRKFFTNPSVFIHISHFALQFLLDQSPCKILRGELTHLSVFLLMNIKVVGFLILIGELSCLHLLFIFQNCLDLLMTEAHTYSSTFIYWCLLLPTIIYFNGFICIHSFYSISERSLEEQK